MKVEVVSIGDDLLFSDVLDTNIAHLSRSLWEVQVPITCKVTVGDDMPMIIDVLRVALERADVVLAIHSFQDATEDRLSAAVSRFVDGTGVALADMVYTEVMEEQLVHLPGVWVEAFNALIVCLPRDRQKMSYLLETAVLPYLRSKVAQQAVGKAAQTTGWKLLRAVGVMESSVRAQLAEMPRLPGSRITYDSFAGQTSIRLWVEGESEQQVAHKLASLQRNVMERLGDHIYGIEDTRLEQVVLQMLAQGQMKLAVAECHTNRIISRTLAQLPDSAPHLALPLTGNGAELADYLHIEPLTDDLTGWCRAAAGQLLSQSGADLGLVVYKNVTQGGVQVVVTLASASGVSVTQRSFGGHPENIDAWAFSLGMAHLRRWLRART